MEKAHKKKKLFVTPVGLLKFNNLKQAAMFGAETVPSFKTTLSISIDESEKLLSDVNDELVKLGKGHLNVAFKTDKNNPGNVLINFRLKSKINLQGGTSVTRHVDLSSTNNIDLDSLSEIPMNSKGQVIFSLYPYSIPKLNKEGVQLQLHAVKIMELGTGSVSYANLFDAADETEEF